MKSFVAFALLTTSFTSLVNAGARNINPAKPPHQSEKGQFGYNDCQNYPDNATSNCQTLWINNLNDFCLFAPPTVNTIGDSERYEVAWCSKGGHGTRLFPPGTITGATWVKTQHYLQITGKGDFSKLNLKKGDYGGELDPHGYDGLGNPIGGLVFGPDPSGKVVQFVEWTQFVSEDTFCIRACFPGPDARQHCEHIYDEMGCGWNMPGTYQQGKFESCNGVDTLPMGLYVQKNGTTSTFHQGDPQTPAAHPAGPSSQCKPQKTIAASPYPKPTPAKKSTPKRHLQERHL